MKKLFKFVAYLLGIVIVLVVAVAVAVPAFFDPNDYRDEAVARVKEATGRDMKIDGEIALTLFPWIGAEVGTVELGNAPGFDDPFFARVERLNVRVKLMPLLSRQVEMDTLTVHGLALNLARDESGKGNWEDLAAGAGGGGGAGAPESGGGSQDGGMQLAGLAIGGLDIKNASMRWTDAQAGQSLSVDQLDVETGALTPGKPVDLKLEARLSGNAIPGGKAELSLSGEVMADPAGGPVTVDGLKLDAKVSGDAIPGGEAELSLAGNLAADPAAGSVTVDGLKLDAKVSGDSIPGGEAELTLAGNLTADPAAGLFAVEDLELGALDLTAAGRLALSGEQVNGKLDVSEFDLKKLLATLGQAVPVTADPDVLGKVALSAELSGTTSAIAVKPLALTLDDSKVEGEVALAGLDRPMPAVAFDLVLDAIDADRYLPPPAPADAAPASTGTGAPAATPGTAASAGAELPLDTLRALDVDGTLKVGELKVSGLTTSDVVVTIAAKDGLIALNPLSARLYDGAYAGDVRLDARDSQPRISTDEKLTGLQIGPLLQDLTGDDRLTGTSEISIKVNGRGADADAIKKSLNGDVAFSFTEGALNGINIARTIREFKAKLSGKTLEPAKETLKTDFSRITGTFQIADGVARNQDLEAMSPLLRITGEGVVDLGADQLDYRPTVTLVATTRGEGGKELEDLVGVPIPLRVHGPLATPEYGVDFDKAVAVVAKSQAQDLIKGQLGEGGISAGKLGESRPGGLGGLVPGAAGGAAAATDDAAPAGTTEPKSSEKSIDEAVKGLKGLLGN